LLFTLKIDEYGLLADIPSDSPSTRKCDVGRRWRFWKAVTHQVIIFYCWLQNIPDYSDTVLNERNIDLSIGCNASKRVMNFFLSSRLYLFIIKIRMDELVE
jgi:hypothetical protein